jgi:hypothetical protein
MSPSKKIDLRQVFICLRPRNTNPPYTLYTCIQYTYSHREGVGVIGGELNQRKGYRGNRSQSSFTKLDRKYDKHLPQRPFTGQYF